MAHLNVIYIVSLENVLVFSKIDDQKIIYPCLFAFIFLDNLLILFFNVFNMYYRKEDYADKR
jgi:hypothetical protein